MRGRGWRRGTLASVPEIDGLLSGLLADPGTFEGGGMVRDCRREVVVEGVAELGAEGRGECGSEAMSGAIWCGS